MASGFDPRRSRTGRAGPAALLGLTALASIFMALLWWYQDHERRPFLGEAEGVPGELETEAVRVPELPPSEFLNTSEQASYVGSEGCRKCHAGAYDAYRETGMGRALAVLDPDNEPPDVVLNHAASGRRFRVYRAGGQMRHQELRITSPGAPAEVWADFAVPYVIGSGRHTRSYLLEVDGFLVESPLTWYTSRRAWGMSPGYDVPAHDGFSRAVDEGCLNCHSGQSRAVDNSFHRIKIHETWIGCERCHGPGSLHVDRWSGSSTADAAGIGNTIDRTIVNQAHLDRRLSESICAQCHLRASAGVMARGRSMNDFRPGWPLDLFRADYRLVEDSTAMTVVGHVEQLRLSRCYQDSTLTCTTCHNPHGFPKKAERAQYYRNQCLGCHSEQACKEDAEVRQRKTADNNCVICHMPTSDTEIPHLAFTHHRIGIHPPRAADAGVARGTGSLRLLSDVSAYSGLDRQRMRGLAYMQAAEDQPDARRAQELEMRAYQELHAVWNAGLRDVEAASALALLAGRQGDDAGEFVTYALSQPAAPGIVRANVLLAAAAWHAERGDLNAAVSTVRDLVQVRRASGDWKLLSFLEERLGHADQARAALEKAAEIDGQRPIPRQP